MLARAGLGKNLPGSGIQTSRVARYRAATVTHLEFAMSTENTLMPAARIAIVTGGSRGLGRNTVVNLAKRGVDSIFTYHSNRDEANRVVAAVAETGRRAIALQLDTGDAASFDTFVQRVQEALATLGARRFDYLVNNAGTSLHKAFDQTTEAELDAIYNIHFKGV